MLNVLPVEAAKVETFSNYPDRKVTTLELLCLQCITPCCMCRSFVWLSSGRKLQVERRNAWNGLRQYVCQFQCDISEGEEFFKHLFQCPLGYIVESSSERGWSSNKHLAQKWGSYIGTFLLSFWAKLKAAVLQQDLSMWTLYPNKTSQCEHCTKIRPRNVNTVPK
jgi:hypothetical protein